MKDLFSTHSGQYNIYRPRYPQELFDFVVSVVQKRKLAWDCGTGNGQVATELANYFDHVYATDISQNQLDEAPNRKNISYSVQSAEQTNFPDHQFDLITTAQAIHWFDIDAFYSEVTRTIINDGIFAVIGYGLAETFPAADAIINRFFSKILGPYWDEERHYLNKKYQTLPFPFREIESPEFSITYNWDFKHVIGYIGTWSAVEHYKNRTEKDPMKLISEELKQCWEDQTHSVTFPIYTRVARIEK